MSSDDKLYQVESASPEAAALGESPLWHAAEQCLYYVDIPGHQVLRLDPVTRALKRWQMSSEPGCIALIEGGGLLVAQRNGLWRLDPASGDQQLLSDAPYDSAKQRFNDGKPDAQGRFWVGTIDDARLPRAGLHCYAAGAHTLMADGIVTSNGLAWSPDQRVLYWSDTKAHEIYRFAFEPATGALGPRQTFAKFAPRVPEQSLDDYGGRPDGAAVDSQGCYWVAMFEGQRLLRLAPDGAMLQEVKLPVRCPTMATFGGADLRTLYITTARENRPAAELTAQPWAGQVLTMRVEVAGLPPHRVKL